MKKIITGIAAAAAIAIIGGTTAFAFGLGHHNNASVPDSTADTTAYRRSLPELYRRLPLRRLSSWSRTLPQLANRQDRENFQKE